MPGVPAVPGPALLSGAVASVFAEEGPLARTLPGYEARAGQRRMAAAVAETLERGGILLAEAGTGTGKTLAYLAPAVLSRHRVLVSTGTKNLQEQILDKDLPVLARALGIPFTATCMKGRGNYLCLHRFDAFRDGFPKAGPPVERGRTRRRGRAAPPPPHLSTPADRVHLTLIEEWAKTTDTGDRAEIDELPEDLWFWNDVSATTENCLGAECPRYTDCFVTRMRQRAAESDLVIVNHHLLCADAAVRQHSFGEVIPECPFVVIDEAHQLEDVASQYFGRAISNYRLEDLVRDGDRLLAARAIPDVERAAELHDALQRVDRDGRALFADLDAKRPGSAQRSAVNGGLFDERLRIGEESLALFADTGYELAASLDGLAATVGLLKDVPEDVTALGRRAAELRDELRFLLRADDPSFVYFLETRGRGVFLKATPIDVSGIVRESIVDRHQSAVLTSATLAVEGRFDYVKSRLGIDDAATILLPSEFDYARQSVLYLPQGMPDPRSRDFPARATDEVVEILGRTEGRAFVLFTSYAMLREVEQGISGRVPYPLLVQGEAPRSILLERFRRTPNCVLLATSSFWQGVDVVGEALSCVVIDKLPFASPADPLVQARMEAIESAGGDSFRDYQVPLAILALLQGLGRLLRHRTDRGVLAILDPRLRTKGYGRRFLASFPPAPVTSDLADIERFFG